jgi:hypothetical protein
MLNRISASLIAVLFSSSALAAAVPPPFVPVPAPTLDEWGLAALGVLIVAVARFAGRWKK